MRGLRVVLIILALITFTASACALTWPIACTAVLVPTTFGVPVNSTSASDITNGLPSMATLLNERYTPSTDENTLSMISPVIQYSLFSPSVQSYFIDNPINIDDSMQAFAQDMWSNQGWSEQGPDTLSYPFVG